MEYLSFSQYRNNQRSSFNFIKLRQFWNFKEVMNQLAIKTIFILYSYNFQNCIGRRILSMPNNQKKLCFKILMWLSHLVVSNKIYKYFNVIKIPTND